MGVPVTYDEANVARVVRNVSCRGHAFDENLHCPCGTTWSQHQNEPSRCRIEAQRCKRTERIVPPAEGTGRR